VIPYVRYLGNIVLEMWPMWLGEEPPDPLQLV
jgi:hypothetical protein